MHQSQPDYYCMARDADAKLILNVAFQQPRIHTLDHCAVFVLLLRGRHGQQRRYHRSHQTFPLQLPLAEEQDEQTCLLGDLQKTCKENTPARQKGSNWIMKESWWLIAHQAMLRLTGRLCQTGGRCRLVLILAGAVCYYTFLFIFGTFLRCHRILLIPTLKICHWRKFGFSGREFFTT